MYTYIYIYKYTHLNMYAYMYICVYMHGPLMYLFTENSLSSHNFNSQKQHKCEGLKSQNHCYIRFKMPVETSNLLGSGPICPDCLLFNWPQWRATLGSVLTLVDARLRVLTAVDCGLHYTYTRYNML